MTTRCQNLYPSRQIVDTFNADEQSTEAAASTPGPGPACRCPRGGVWRVCGSDSVTYWNSCLAECAGAAVRCQGGCPCAGGGADTPRQLQTTPSWVQQLIQTLVEYMKQQQGNRFYG